MRTSEAKKSFPYSYMKDARVLRKKHLPKKEEFFNDLTHNI